MIGIALIAGSFIPIKRIHKANDGTSDKAEYVFYYAEATKEVAYYNKTGNYEERNVLHLYDASEETEEGLADELTLTLKNGKIIFGEDEIQEVDLVSGNAVSLETYGEITCRVYGLICDNDKITTKERLAIGKGLDVPVYDSVCTDEDKKNASAVSNKNGDMPYFTDYLDVSVSNCRKDADGYTLVGAETFFKDYAN